jgi:hypothetical protein
VFAIATEQVSANSILDADAIILYTLRSISPSQGLVRLVPKWNVHRA